MQINGILVSLNNNTQNGVSIVWSHQLAGNMTLATSADWSHSVDNVEPHVSTRLGTAPDAAVDRSVAVYDGVCVGARYQDSRSNAFGSYREMAVIVGVSYIFH